MAKFCSVKCPNAAMDEVFEAAHRARLDVQTFGELLRRDERLVRSGFGRWFKSVGFQFTFPSSPGPRDFSRDIRCALLQYLPKVLPASAFSLPYSIFALPFEVQ
jgi:hypothetical protein